MHATWGLPQPPWAGTGSRAVDPFPPRGASPRAACGAGVAQEHTVLGTTVATIVSVPWATVLGKVPSPELCSFQPGVIRTLPPCLSHRKAGRGGRASVIVPQEE